MLFLRSFCSSVPSALFTGDSIITDREDPYSAFNFILEIDGVKAAGFSEVSGPTTETDVPAQIGDLQQSIPPLVDESAAPLQRSLHLSSNVSCGGIIGTMCNTSSGAGCTSGVA